MLSKNETTKRYPKICYAGNSCNCSTGRDITPPMLTPSSPKAGDSTRRSCCPLFPGSLVSCSVLLLERRGHVGLSRPLETPSSSSGSFHFICFKKTISSQ